MLFDRGPSALYDGIAAYLERWAGQDALRLDDPRAAAIQLVMLCHGDLVLRAQLGILGDGADTEVEGTVARAVAVFLRAYGRRRA